MVARRQTGMKLPNLRLNALRLGLRLMSAAANPFARLGGRYADKGLWQPEHPFGLPRWWPYSPGSGVRLPVEELELMRSVLPQADSRQRSEQASLQPEASLQPDPTTRNR